MVTYENECVGCPPEKGCLGSTCPYRKVKHLYCDKCKEDCGTLYVVGGAELCESCALEELEKVE